MAAKYDWPRFWIHFICGAVPGFVIGLSAFIFFDLSSAVTWGLICWVTLTIAILAGVYGDSFWEKLLGSRLFRLLVNWL